MQPIMKNLKELNINCDKLNKDIIIHNYTNLESFIFSSELFNSKIDLKNLKN